jgi:hypothetical protein
LLEVSQLGCMGQVGGFPADAEKEERREERGEKGSLYILESSPVHPLCCSHADRGRVDDMCLVLAGHGSVRVVRATGLSPEPTNGRRASISKHVRIFAPSRLDSEHDQRPAWQRHYHSGGGSGCQSAAASPHSLRRAAEREIRPRMTNGKYSATPGRGTHSQ